MTTPDRTTGRPPARTATRYAERLTVPWWLWLAALGVAALASAEVLLGRGGVLTWVPYLILLPSIVAGLVWLGRIRISVGGGELRVDDARLPVEIIESVTELDAAARRDLLGPYAQPYAFVIQRPWVAGAVRIQLADPADPTPYWVVSSRHPAKLAAAVHQERAAVAPR